MSCSLRIWHDNTQYKLSFKLDEERSIFLRDIQKYLPGVAGLHYYKDGKSVKVKSTGSFLIEPVEGWDANVYHSKRLEMEVKVWHRCEVPGEEEQLDNFPELDQVPLHRRFYDSSKLIMGIPPLLNLPPLMAEIFPYALQPRFDRLYGNYAAVYEKEPVKKLVDRTRPTKRQRSRSSDRNRRQRSRSSSRRSGRESARSPRHSRDYRRQRSSSRRRRSRSRRREESKEPDPPGLEEIQFVMEKPKKKTVEKIDDDVVELSSEEEVTVTTRERSRDESRDRSRDHRRYERRGERSHHSSSERDHRDYQRDERYRRDQHDDDHRRSHYDRDYHDGRPRRREHHEEDRERRRHYDERVRCQEERRRIRAERIQLELELRGKKEEASWLEKSEDFLKKLGIPTDLDTLRKTEETSVPSREYDADQTSVLSGSTGYREVSPSRERSSEFRSHDQYPAGRASYPSSRDPYPPSPPSRLGRELPRRRRSPSFSDVDSSRGSLQRIFPDAALRDQRSQPRLDEDESIFGRRLPSPPEEVRFGRPDRASLFADRPMPGSSAGSGAGADIDLRRQARACRQQSASSLRAGNYMYVVFDMITLGSGLSSEPYQIGAVSPFSESFVRCILPKRRAQEAEMYADQPMVWFKNKFHLNNRVTGHMEPCRDEALVFGDFLEFLERIKNRTRPSLDGVVLICENKSTIPPLLRSLARLRMLDDFWRIVPSIGSMSSIRDYVMGLEMYKNPKSLPIEGLYFDLFHEVVSFSTSFCDIRAKYVCDILTNQMAGPPNYANFFKEHTFPRDSPGLKQLLKPTSLEESMDLYGPLKLFMTNGMKSQQADLDDLDVSESEIPPPSLVARKMCRSLIEAGFEFDELLEMANHQGLSAMELRLRTVLLQKIAGQSRTVVDTAIQTTKLVVGFFLQNSHKSLDDIYREYTEAGEEDEGGNAAGDWIGGGRTTSQLEDLRRFIFHRMLRSGSDINSVKTQSCINVLVKANLPVAAIQSLYNEVNRIEANLLDKLKRILSRFYLQYGPSAMSLDDFLQHIVEFIKQISTEDQPAALLTMSEATQQRLPPTWYRCRSCQRTNHWQKECQYYPYKPTKPDLVHLKACVEAGRLNVGIIPITKSLRILKGPLKKHFSFNQEEDPELADLAVDAVIASLAAQKIFGNTLVNLKPKSDGHIYNTFLQWRCVEFLSPIFNPDVVLHMLIDCIKNYL